VSKIRSAGIIIVIGLVTIIFQIIGHQQSSYGQVTADTLIIEVSNNGEATVTQELTPSTTVSRVTVNPIAKDLSDVLAVDENKVVLSFSTSADIITIDTLGSANVTLTYGAKIAYKVASDIWELNYNSTGIQSTIVLPALSEIIYVNDIPIDIVGNTITMPPGETSIRYKIKSVDTRDFPVQWENRTFFVQAVTSSEVQDVHFVQSSKTIELTLDTSMATLVIIPKSLLGGPYTVSGPAGEVVDFRQYYQNSTHSWIRIEPNDINAMKIVGTTVIPEFPLLPLFGGVVMAMVVLLAILTKHAIIVRRR
jgi:hypothetical protein